MMYLPDISETVDHHVMDHDIYVITESDVASLHSKPG